MKITLNVVKALNLIQMKLLSRNVDQELTLGGEQFGNSHLFFLDQYGCYKRKYSTEGENQECACIQTTQVIHEKKF